MRVATYFYLRSLAVADIGVLTVNFPLAVIKSHFLWPFGEVFCLYIYPLTDVFFGASIWSIAVIAIERHRGTSKQTGHKTRRSDQRRPASFARWVLALVWCVSLVVTAVPNFLIMRYSREHELCYPQWPSVNAKQPNVYKQAYILTMLIFWYVLPLTLIIITSAQITRQLNRSSAFHRAMESEWLPSSRQAHNSRFVQEERRKLKQNKKAKKLLTPIVALFCISMLPFHTFRLIALYFKEFVYWKYYMVMFNVVILFTISNSALDPLVYCLVSREFRRGFRSVLSGDCGKMGSVSAPTRRPQGMMGIHGVPSGPTRTKESREEAHRTDSQPKTEHMDLLIVSPV